MSTFGIAEGVDPVTDTEPVRPSAVVWLRGTRSDRTTARRVLAERAIDLIETDDRGRLLHALADTPDALCLVDLSEGAGGSQALREVQHPEKGIEAEWPKPHVHWAFNARTCIERYAR